MWIIFELVKNEGVIMTKQIPIFFATDDNYAPFLGVAIHSLIKNASKKYFYDINVLTASLSEENKKVIGAMANDYVKITFVDVSNELERIKDKLHMRDYYTNTTYFRFFVPKMFPQYDKALYLDCDVIIADDISKLYNHNILNNYVGAIVEEVMTQVDVFGTYAEKLCGIRRDKFFNAGVLVMNLKKMRNDDIEGGFIELLSRYKFQVTQDEDYLNVLCKNKVLMIDVAWNKTPIKEIPFDESRVKLAHYKINWKPWHFENVMFGDLFWSYAKETPYFDKIDSILKNYTEEQRQRDFKQYANLEALAESEIKRVESGELKPATELEMNLFEKANRIVEGATSLLADTGKQVSVVG